MENCSSQNKGEDHIELPPGFRFHPTDEELIVHYLSKKVLDGDFNARAIGEVDLNKCEPWDLPWKAKMGEKEWYFFCVRDRKYPTGLRTNRATDAGYWKATGKDKEIYRGKTLVGMKKTLVFYKGRAPKGEKTNWVMHEYRLDGKSSMYNFPKTAKNEWVICRVFQKSSCGKKTHISGLMRISSLGEDLGSSLLPPLMDSPYMNKIRNNVEPSHVTCFSNAMEGQRHQDEMMGCFTSPFFSTSENPASDAPPPPLIFSKASLPASYYSSQGASGFVNLQHPASALMPDQTILKALLESNGYIMNQSSCKTEREMVSHSQETGLSTDRNTEISSVVSNHESGQRHFESLEGPSSTGPVDLDCLWNY